VEHVGQVSGQIGVEIRRHTVTLSVGPQLQTIFLRLALVVNIGKANDDVAIAEADPDARSQIPYTAGALKRVLNTAGYRLRFR
jgi:hypothetical protein